LVNGKSINIMKKIPSSCADCGEDKLILTQVSTTVEIIYLCSDCYKDRYLEEARNQIEN
jgi:hypothetical protein